MTRYFVVAVQDLTADETRKISDLFRGEYGWWHWIDGFWLVTDSSNRLSAEIIREEIGEAVGEKRRMILEVNPETWSGFGPKSEDNDMFSWIHRNWN